MDPAEIVELFSCTQRQSPDYDYRPDVDCDCGLKAPRWMSWTTRNPGRRFNTCRRRPEEGGCGFFKFFDEAFPERAAVVINGLCKNERVQSACIGKMRIEISDLRSELRNLHMRDSVFNGMVDEIMSLKEEKDKLGQRLKRWRLMFAAVVVFLLLLLFVILLWLLPLLK